MPTLLDAGLVGGCAVHVKARGRGTGRCWRGASCCASVTASPPTLVQAGSAHGSFWHATKKERKFGRAVCPVCPCFFHPTYLAFSTRAGARIWSHVLNTGMSEPIRNSPPTLVQVSGAGLEHRHWRLPPPALLPGRALLRQPGTGAGAAAQHACCRKGVCRGEAGWREEADSKLPGDGWMPEQGCWKGKQACYSF